MKRRYEKQLYICCIFIVTWVRFIRRIHRQEYFEPTLIHIRQRMFTNYFFLHWLMNLKIMSLTIA